MLNYTQKEQRLTQFRNKQINQGVILKELFSGISHWIWLENVPEVNCYLQFRQSFIPEAGRQMTLHISAEGQYAAYLNGAYLPSTQYTDYPFYKSVQVIRLPPAEACQNELLIQVLYFGADTSVTRREQPGLRFELWQGERLLCASGKETEAGRMSGYRSGPVRLVTPQLGSGFIYENPQKEIWQPAVPVKKQCKFILRPIPELETGPCVPALLLSQGVFTNHVSALAQYAGFHFRELESMLAQPESVSQGGDADGFSVLPGEEGIRPQTRFPSEDGLALRTDEGDGIYLLFDLKEETVGCLVLDLVCDFPAHVDVSYGEHLEDLRLRTDVGGRHFTFRWEAQSERKRFVHRFHRLGGRYLQLLIHSREVTVYYAGLIPVTYPMRADAQFWCSDHLHSRIYEVAKRTLLCCVHEHYEDCPWREQALYAFDARNQMLFGYYAFGEFVQPRASLKLLALSQREDGLLELCAPARLDINIPSFSLMFIVELEEYCRYSGDVAFGEELLPVVARILRTLHGHVRDGLVWNFREPGYWNFYEWRPLLEATPIWRTDWLPPSAEAPLQLSYLLALQRTALLCRYLGRETDGLSDEIQMLMDGLEQFWNPQEEAYASFLRDGRQIQYAELVQALALYTGAIPVRRNAPLRRKLAAGVFLPISMSASIFKYEALLQQPETYGPAVFEEVAERWGAMLYQGATTFWETEQGAEDFDRAGSLCHAWNSVPVYLYGAYILGVRPERPGVWSAYEPVPSGIRGAGGVLYPPEGRMEIQAS